MSLSVFPYPGGKTFHLEDILQYFPPHQRYIEPFGGSAALLLNKSRSDVEVYNDLDSDVVHFFRVLSEQREDLQEWLRAVPYSREVHLRWGKAFFRGHRPSDDIERAGRWFYLRYAQFNGKLDGISGFKISRDKNEAVRFQNAVEDLETIAERLRPVILECDHYREIVDRYDGPDALFYFDPPYVGNGAYYNAEGFDHGALVRTLEDIEGQWICSYGELPEALDEARQAHDWPLRSYRIRYTMSVEEDDELATERLVMNFDPDEVPQFRSAEQTGLETFTG